MKKTWLLWTFVLSFAFLNAQQVSFEEFDLDNGLHVIMHQDNAAPIITVGAMHDVGGKDSGGDNNPERTGFAHFFEHLLASGPTKNIAKGTWRDIRAEHGGDGNAYTTTDETYYYQSFPSNNLKLALWMQAERLLHPIIDQDAVDTQNEVVKEERRLRVDNSPYGRVIENINKNLFAGHPYQVSVLGEMAHLDAATLEEFQAYFDKWYVPSNSVLVVAGDIDYDKTKQMIEDYFSEISSGPKPMRNFQEMKPINETIRTKVYDPNIQIPAIFACYQIPKQTERDNYILDMVSAYLSRGKSSILYKKLVDEQKQAFQVAAISLSQRDGGIYAMYALPVGETSLSDLLSEMDEEITKMQNELISERDYQKLQNQFENQFVNSNSSIQGVANSLARYYMLYDDVNLINTQLDIYRSITREDIQAVVKKYLNPNQRVEIEYLPENKEN